MKTTRRVAITTLFCAGVATVAVLARPATADSSTPTDTVADAEPAVAGEPAESPDQRRPSVPPENRRKINADGHSYGSAAEATSPEDEPDLILVLATNGRQGYVWKKELHGDAPSNPAEAATANSGQRVIAVYEKDGKTRIGKFVIDGGSRNSRP